MLYTVILDTNNPAGSSIDLQVFHELVSNGTVCGTTQVWNSNIGRWVDAQHHPQLLSLFSSSIWDAWEQDSGFLFSKTEEPTKNMPSEKDPLLGHDVSTKDPLVVSEVEYIAAREQIFDHGLNKESEASTLEDESIELTLLSEDIAEEDLPMLSDFSLIPLAEVAASKAREASVSHNNHPRPIITPPLIIPPRRERPEFTVEPQRFSFVRVAISIVVGAICILGMLNYMKSLNKRSYNPPLQSEEQPIDAQEKQWSIEQDIRKNVGEEIIPLNPESSFEDILHVELQRVGITSIQVRASVTKWTGRKQEDPKEIDVRLRVEGTGELDKDLATISLIFAKYIEFYFLDVLRLEVCIASDEDTFLCSPLNPEIIRRFYLKRIEYDAFFTDVFVLKN